MYDPILLVYTPEIRSPHCYSSGHLSMIPFKLLYTQTSYTLTLFQDIQNKSGVTVVCYKVPL